MKRLFGTLLLLLACSAAFAAPPSRPDLIVVVSIDQFPYRYIQRFAPYFGDGGFNRFLEHGANFTHALYPYATTYTGPGHAALGTGSVPARSGIVSNTWYDRLTAAPLYCATDKRVTPPYSPVNLQSDSLGDRLQEKYPGAKVISVSLKDRAAILMAGRKATAAYWLDPTTSHFTSSTYYRGANHTVLDEFNATLPAYVHAHTVWKQSTFIPAADLERLTHDPESLRKYKTNSDGLGVAFPHPIDGLEALTSTPYGNGLVLGLAERLVDAEQLGTEDGSPDLLFVSLSSQDYLGHDYGPDSLEAADSVVRTDRALAGFFAFLDQRFGKRYTIALSADHGVQSIPEVARDLGRDAGRIMMRNPTKKMLTYGDLAKVAPDRVLLEKRVAASLGQKITDATPLTHSMILMFEEPAIYLSWSRIAELKLDGERVKSAFRREFLKIRGVSAAFTNTQLLDQNPSPSPIEAAVRRSFRADRSGDVIVTLRAGYIWGYSKTGTTHGQPVEADQHVPVMLWGDGIVPATYDLAVAPTDLAKSLGALVGVEAGGESSKPLPCLEPTTTGAEAAPAASTTSVSTSDFQEILTLMLAKEDADRHAKWIAGEHLPDAALAAFSALRTIVRDPEAARTLPAGTLRLDEVAIDGDGAHVRVWHGPIPQPRPGEMLLACGSGTTYTFDRVNGAWVMSPTVGIVVC